MAEEKSLLAYLVPKLTTSLEDTATEALAFILNKSALCRDALNSLLRDGDFSLAPIVLVRTQVSYPDGQRPDMVGYDGSRVARLLVESKFWAELQPDQAIGYFSKLDASGPGVLLFIAPEVRGKTLWSEITRQMASPEYGLRLVGVERIGQMRRARIDGSDNRLELVSWTLLLDHLAAAVQGGTSVASDIHQLPSLAQREDEEAFQPLHQEEFAPALPRRLRALHRLIDDVILRAEGQGLVTTAGRASAAQRDGYGRYFQFTAVPGDMLLCVDLSLWTARADTPIWLRMSKEVHPEGLLDRFPN